MDCTVRKGKGMTKVIAPNRDGEERSERTTKESIEEGLLYKNGVLRKRKKLH